MAGDARLFVLATVDRLGEAHGHEIMREADIDHVDEWAHVSTGSIYSAVRKLQVEGCITGVRSEQMGKYPARTVYQLTLTGTQALHDARAEALYAAGLPTDPFDLALSLSDGLPADVLEAALRARLEWYEQEQSQRLAALDQLSHRLEPTARAVFEHMLVRLQTEIDWHISLLKDVGSFETRRGSD